MCPPLLCLKTLHLILLLMLRHLIPEWGFLGQRDKIYDKDFDHDYLDFLTLERSYLLKLGGNVVKRPQHMLMRVSVGN